MPHKVVKAYYKLKWPDTVEIREDEEGKRTIAFVFQRSNSRPFDYQQTDFAHTLREFGHDVFVRVGGLADITIEEFELHGVYTTKVSQSVQSRQGLYNKTHELRELEAQLVNLPQDDPTYYHKAMRVSHLRTMLSQADNIPAMKDLKRSDEQLRKLEQLVAQQQEENVDPHKYDDMPDELLWNVPMNKITPLFKSNRTIAPRWQIAKTRQILNQLNAELTLQPDNLELRGKIIEEERRLQDYTSQLQEVLQQQNTTPPKEAQ